MPGQATTGLSPEQFDELVTRVGERIAWKSGQGRPRRLGLHHAVKAVVMSLPTFQRSWSPSSGSSTRPPSPARSANLRGSAPRRSPSSFPTPTRSSAAGPPWSTAACVRAGRGPTSRTCTPASRGGPATATSSPPTCLDASPTFPTPYLARPTMPPRSARQPSPTGSTPAPSSRTTATAGPAPSPPSRNHPVENFSTGRRSSTPPSTESAG